MGIEYVDGPRDQAWEVDNDRQPFTLFVQRRGANDRETDDPPYEIFYPMPKYHDLAQSIAAYLAARLNELDALAAWECQGCGARFASRVPPAMLEGVTHCSRCVEVEAYAAHLDTARARIALLEARLAALCGAAQPLDTFIHDHDAAWRESTLDTFILARVENADGTLTSVTFGEIRSFAVALTAAREVLGG